MKPREVFISHSGDDVLIARELRTVLEGAGYSCWLAPDDVTGTDPWAEQILGAITATRVMIVLISKHANKSQHVSREVNLALARNRAVLPIRIEPVAPGGSLEYLLSLVQRIDAFPPPIADHGTEVLRRLDAILGRGASAERRPAHERATRKPPTTPVPLTDTESVDQPPPVSADPSKSSTVPTPGTEDDSTATQTGTEPVVGIGSRIAGFTIEALVGEGGMAAVYRAHQDEPSRAVALKVIRADHAADATYRHRFMAEKDTLASLEHPSIVPIYAAGQSDGVLYIAMRLVDGPDLAGRLAATGRLTLKQTVDLLRPIADGIDYAHEMGVIHRDIKPSNIMIDRGGRPYLTDFGLGKRIEGTGDSSVTGVAIGTLTYMAPEQFTGKIEPKLASKIDIYSLGCVAFACLTGAPPFLEGSPERVMYAHTHEAPPSVLAVRADLPSGVDAVIGRALAKDPKDRYGSAVELVEALAAAGTRIDEGPTIPVPIAAAGSPFQRVQHWVAANTAVAAIGSAILAIALVVVASGLLAPNHGGVASATASPSAPGSASTAGPSPVPSASSLVAVGATPTPTLASTEPGASSPPPTASPIPNPSPSHNPPPVVIVDDTPPQGGDIVIDAEKSVTTSKAVTIRLTSPTDKSGIAGYLLSNTSTRPDRSAIPFDSVVPWTLSGSARGIRTVYVWFQDASPKGNWTPARPDTIMFDHAPVPGSAGDLTFNYSASTLAGKSTMTLTFFDTSLGTPIATDVDGDYTLSVTKLWIIQSNQSTLDQTAALTANGTQAKYSLTSTYCDAGPTTFTYGFSVVDTDNVSRNGGFKLHVCY